MIVAQINPRITKSINDILAGECFLYGKDVMLKVQSHYDDSNIHAVRLADGAQLRFEYLEDKFEVLGQMHVSF